MTGIWNMEYGIIKKQNTYEVFICTKAKQYKISLMNIFLQ